MSRFFLSLVVVLLLGGCGYQIAGRSDKLPLEVQSLYIELFANRTYEPYLENRLTDRVTERFARKQPLRLVEKRERADAQLSGEITRYTSTPISYSSSDVITEYRSNMVIAVTLRRSFDDRVLWKGNLEWSEEYPASLDKAVQEDNEAAAIGVIVDRLTDELYSRITENF